MTTGARGAGAWVLVAMILLLAVGGGTLVHAAPDEAPALLAFKQSVAGTSDSLTDWTAGTDPCDDEAPWVGVFCTAGRVTSVILAGWGLSGTLPSTLNLTDLTTLDLVSNKLDGSLPATLAVRSLQRFLLESNQLTGTLPASWGANFPALQELTLQGNKLAGTMPPTWLQAAGFSSSFTVAVQPDNPLLCGAISPAANHTLLYSGQPGSGGGGEQRLQHEIITTLGSCAQDGNCGGATVNTSAPNLFDLAWANRVAALDLEYFNPSVQQNGEPKQGSPVALPCYPSHAPSFFGSDVAYRKATWQAGTEGSRSSYLPVSGNRQPRSAEDCSQTLQAPGYWMVDLQRETSVLGVLVRAGPQQMTAVSIHVSSTPVPASGALCKGGDSYDPSEGKIILCQRVLKGRYVSITAQSKVSLCVVEVYPLVGNAALGKGTTASAGTGDSTQSSQVVNGNMANTACATVVSGSDLAAWITVDLGYEAAVETVVVQNGYSRFDNDLYIRLGNTPVVDGSENPVCSQGQTLGSRNTLPIQCTGTDGGPATGRFLTLYRKLNQASDMYICQVLAFLAVGPSRFYQSPPAPPSPPLSPPPAPPPPAPRGRVNVSVTSATTSMVVSLDLSGPGLLPLDEAVQANIIRAAAATWEGNLGMGGVRGLAFSQLEPVASQSVQSVSSRELLQAGVPAGPLPDNGSGWVAVQLVVDTAAGQAPAAATFIEESGWPGGELQAQLENEGMPGIVPTIKSITDLGAPPPPPPPSPPMPAPPAPSSNGDDGSSSSSSSVPIGAIAGGVAGGIVALVAVAGLLYARRRRRLRSGPSHKGEYPDDGGSESPKVGAMEQGRQSSSNTSTTLLGLPKAGDAGDGYSLAVAAAGGPNGSDGSMKLELDAELFTRGPPADIITFLADDTRSDHSAMGTAAGPGNGQPSDSTPIGSARSTSGVGGCGLRRNSGDCVASVGGSLQKQRSVMSRIDSGVSELWTVGFKELDIQKQIGEGSFGKVYLAKWRETTVAVKVLGAVGGGAAPGLDDEFPDAATSKGHPLYESLQKEAAMMASLRHPSIVMYLGVCLDPPAVVTEYCARGSLNDVLKRARTSPLLAAQLDWARRLNMALDAAKGMLYLHSCCPPIIHRDLKSANLLVDKHWRVRVCDFNLSRVMEDSAVLSSVAATNPRWLAPEILSGKGYTFASDVYAFGICMWEMLTWQVPYHEYGPWQVVAMVTESAKRPEVPAPEDLPTPCFSGDSEYLSLMHECWAQDPAARPTFAAVISRLRRMLALEASLRRESPTKVSKGLPTLSNSGHSSSLIGGSSLAGVGGDETPLSRSRLTSLTAAPSDLFLSPEPRSMLAEESDSDMHTLVLSASPSMLSGGTMGGPAGASPPRPRSHSSSGSPAQPQLSSIAGGGTEDSEAATEAEAAAAVAPAAIQAQHERRPAG